MLRYVLVPLFLVVASLSAQPADGNEVIRRMYEKYEGQWYPDLTFKQQSIYYRNGNVAREEIWYEAIKMPRGLVIKIGSKDSGNGLMFTSDTQYVFREGVLVRKARRIHDLLVLGFEVYFIDPSETAAKLEEQGFDLSRVTTEDGVGGKYFVVGSPDSAQFWITADTFLFTKLKRKDRQGNTTEVQFNKYVPLGKGWIAPEVIFIRNGQTAMKEVYSDWSIDKVLPESIFDLSAFQAATW